MTRISAVLFALLILILPTPTVAQQDVWLQIEAQPTLTQAEERARAYAAAFPNVAGFRIGSGWYAIALGPYSRTQADGQLNTLRSERMIPGDSFIAFSQNFGQAFWPVGLDARTQAAAPAAPATMAAQPVQPPAPAPAAQPEQPQTLPDESPREARASEGLLTLDERKLLQEAMQWEGFYTAAIDGAFGAGTRRAMANYQADRGYEATGILTSRQRAQLLGEYRAVFAALGLQTVTDPEAGIEILLPMGMVARDTAEPPFVRYNSTTPDGVRVLLISQEGDQSTLFGLYDIMQTLEVVPPQGERARGSRSFTLSGQSSTLRSHTYAELSDGAIKGFTLIWSPADERVMSGVVEQMKASFRPIAGVVMPDIAGDGASQQIDLMAGLQIRRPALSRSGFFIDDAGTVLTTTEILAQCDRVTVDDDYDASVVATDAALGLAVLRPLTPLAPVAVAAFQSAIPRLQSEIAVAGFSYEDVLDLPSVTFGMLADIRGLAGEADLSRLELTSLPGDVGGPVFDQTGAVLGMLQPRRTETGRTLPEDVQFAVNTAAIARFLGENNLVARASDSASQIAPEDITTLASDVTVLVSCWK